ncbi:MAG: PAS domain S-box protein [Deltaproteobacteria bacterium]|nr:PAS domain S-box protein [Deltaproteobacteria bacterium]
MIHGPDDIDSLRRENAELRRLIAAIGDQAAAVGADWALRLIDQMHPAPPESAEWLMSVQGDLNLSDIAANIPGAVYQYLQKPDGTQSFPYLSPAAEKLFDVPFSFICDPDWVIGHIHPDDLPGYFASVTEATKNLERWTQEMRVIKPNGQTIWVFCSSSPRLLPDESIIWNGVILDITQYKQAVGALKESEDRLRLLVKNSSDILVIIDSDGTQRYVSPSAERITGFAASELMGKSLAEIIHPDDMEKISNAWNEAVEHPEKLVTVQYRHIHKTRGWVHLEAVGQNFEAEPSVGGFVANVRDITERMRTEEELRARSQEMKVITDNMRDTVWLMDLDFRTTWISPSVIRTRGYTLAELAGMPLERHLTPDSLAKITALIAEHMTPERLNDPSADITVCAELEFYRKDGSTFWADTVTNVLRDSHGRPSSILGVSRDITERKLVEEALEKRMVALVRPLDSPEGIAFEDMFNLKDIQRLQDEFAYATGVASIITHTDGRPITAPSNFCRLCSDIIRKTEKGLANCYHSDAVIGRACLEGPTIQPCLSGGLWDAGAGITVGGRHIANWLIGQVRDETQSTEKMRAYARKIGVDEETMVEAFLEVPAMNRDQFEKVSQALFTLASQLSSIAYQNVQQARFIEDRNKALAALQKSEQKHRILFDSAADAIFIHDLFLRMLAVNPAASKMLGYTHDELMAMDVGRIDSPEQAQYVPQRIAMLIEHGHHSFESVHVRKDGSTIPIEANAQMITWDGQSVVMSICRDMTERKRAGEERQKLQEQLNQAQKMESVGRLAGGVAHDFNNMLGGILGYTEMALEQVDPAHPIHGDLLQIKKATERSAELTRQLLGFARQQTVAPRMLDLNETVEGMLKMLRRIIGEDIDLAWLPGKNLGTVKIDPAQIDQLLANLCINAKDAMGASGKVTIETDNAVFDETYCAGHAGSVPGDYVMLAVSDNGCGMDRETAAKIFEPFFTTKEVGKGTGLGLATVYGIVKQNDGYINVYSEPGHGSTFRIYLPRHEAKAEHPAGTDAAKPSSPGHETILVVEDEPIILESTTKMLKRQGYRVLAASTPVEAIRIARENHGEIHLLMTDVVMPEMNGRDLAKNLLSLYPKMKRLFMSGYTANVIAHHGVLEEGMHFLQKPFNPKGLYEKVREALNSD